MEGDTNSQIVTGLNYSHVCSIAYNTIWNTRFFQKPTFVTLRFLSPDIRKLQIGGRSLFIYRGHYLSNSDQTKMLKFS